MMKRPNGKAVATGVVVAIILLISGQVAFEQGRVTGKVEGFVPTVDLVPVVDSELKDSRSHKAVVKSLLTQIEYRDGVIEDQRIIMEDQTAMISDQVEIINAKNDYINELENRPPEIVEVVKVVEKIVYVEVPCPEPPPPYIPPVIDNDDGDRDIVTPAPEPEPEPPCDGDWDKKHDGRHDHKDHHDKRGGKGKRRNYDD